MACEEAFDRQIMLYENPRKKKRSKFVHIRNTTVKPFKPKIAKKKMVSTTSGNVHPCTECGKQFSSWKALFGHMRCHPERQWRGINPPPHYHGQRSMSPSSPPRMYFTNVDHEVATCLLMLANGNGASAIDVTPLLAFDPKEGELMERAIEFDVGSSSNLDCGFECSSCKKVLGTHQALGGHRASHKNVKGCFANAGSIDGEEEEEYEHQCFPQHYEVNEGKLKVYGAEEEEAGKMILTLGHQCSICFRVFPSGQALGGHKRCHWEKGENPSASREVCCLDLNLPAPMDDRDGNSCSAIALDLKLSI